MLHRKESTINYITKEGKRAVPIDQVKAIFAVGRISVTSGVISFFSKMGIPIHFFGYYGNYEGSYYPRRRLVSGHALVSQVASFLDKECRMSIAQALVHGCISNMKTVVDSYVSRMNELQIVSTQLELIASEVTGADTIPVLMSLEGRAWSIYYESFNHIIKGFQMGPRVKRPPNNPVNALVSLGNSMLYVTTLTQIYHTQLDPSVSFLHEPLERRFSLALDISEVFKPGLVDTLIFRLLNLGSIKEEHFDAEFKSCMLNDEGRGSSSPHSMNGFGRRTSTLG